jgi:hypothetical protein
MGSNAAPRRGGPTPMPPIAASSFVGRVREIEQLSRLLRRSRLVTLIGPGGPGKTRLALEPRSGQFRGTLVLQRDPRRPLNPPPPPFPRTGDQPPGRGPPGALRPE